MFVPLLPRFFASPSFALCVRNLTTSASANMLTVREALHQALDEELKVGIVGMARNGTGCIPTNTCVWLVYE